MFTKASIVCLRMGFPFKDVYCFGLFALSLNRVPVPAAAMRTWMLVCDILGTPFLVIGRLSL